MCINKEMTEVSELLQLPSECSASSLHSYRCPQTDNWSVHDIVIMHNVLMASFICTRVESCIMNSSISFN